MEQQKQSRITSWLSKAPAWQFSLYAIAVSFSTYFCMYGFRKAFSVARFEDQTIWGFDLKMALVISQIIGYTLAKYLGTKFCSEIQARNRAFAILLCIAGAETALVLYGILPGDWIMLGIFLNGLSLGGVWGLVYGFLEGRKVSEILGAGLSCSYIIASGYAKTVGKSWLDEGVSEVWMPALTGACYLPFLLVAVWFLKQIPPPSEADIAERVLRKPMDSKDRWLFVKQFLPGLSVLFIVYFFLTAYRDFRDNFQIDIYSDLGRDSEPMLLTATETPIGFIVVGCLALLYLVKDNRRGLFGTHFMMLSGMVLIGVSTYLFDKGMLDFFNGQKDPIFGHDLASDIVWLFLVGLGAYLAYVPYGCVLFDRMIAGWGTAATAVFAIYAADALGYTGSIAMLFYKELGARDLNYAEFFKGFSYFTSVFCTLGFVLSWIYFWRKKSIGEVDTATEEETGKSEGVAAGN